MEKLWPTYTRSQWVVGSVLVVDQTAFAAAAAMSAAAAAAGHLPSAAAAASPAPGAPGPPLAAAAGADSVRRIAGPCCHKHRFTPQPCAALQSARERFASYACKRSADSNVANMSSLQVIEHTLMSCSCKDMV